MAQVNLYEFILHSKTSHDASVVHEQVEAKLIRYVGRLGVRRNLGVKAQTGAVNVVKKFLSTIANRLKQTPEIDLYQTHILCQKYLKQLWSPKDPSSYDYLESRCELMDVYKYLKKFDDAQSEGLELLNEIHTLYAGPGSRIPEGQVLPIYHPKMKLPTAMIVIKVSMVLLYASSRCIKEDDMLDDKEELENIVIYKYILSLAKETKKWIQLFRSDSLYPTLRKWLAGFLGDRTLPLVLKCSQSTISLITEYCIMTLSNFAKASMDDAMCNFGRDICHSVFSNSNVNFSDASGIAIAVLDCIAERCREHPVGVVKFLELAVYCTVNHGPATAEQCDNLASFFHTTADMFSPPEANKIPVHLLLKHLAIALVINDLDSYRCWDPRFSPRSNLQVSYDLEAHLDEWTQLIYKRYPELDIFFYDRLSTLILSNEIIDAHHEDYIDPINLVTVPAVLDRFIDDFSTYCGFERNELIDNKHVEVAAKVGAANFMLLLTTKDMKRYDDALMMLKKENRFKPKLLEYLTQNLERVSKAFDGNGRIHEVIELSKLCCMIQWERVSGFCKMLKSTEYGVSSGFEEYAIVDLVTKASQDSASLLLLFNKHRRAELNEMLTQLIERWLDANNTFDIPSPVALVHQWVEIQYEQTQDNNPKTIYSLVLSLETSKQSDDILLEQELHEYRKNKYRNPQICKKMEMLIEDTISKTNGRIYGLSRSDSLIKRGARIASCGPISCQSDSIKYIDQAISILVDLENTSKKVTGEQVLPLLIKAYCSKALFKRIVHPLSKGFTEDIENALKAWDHQSSSHDKIKLRDNDINLFFHVADLLALEGYRELHSKLYKMIKRMKLAVNCELSDFLEMAWKSGSLNHALCTSPVDVLIIKEIEDANVQFWINCGKTQEQKAGIKQCLSVFPTLSSVDLHNDAHAKEAQKTINEVKEAISTLINEGSDSFGAARLHYDLAERFIAKGLFIEALSHATESYLLRHKHLSECFDIEWHLRQGSIVGRGDTKIANYDCTRFNMNPSSVSPFAHTGPQTYPTPWSTVRCYLESSLQTGTVQEMIGNGDEAEIFFLRGQKIATLLRLPMFIGGFSTALGKIYQKKLLWTLALDHLNNAQEHDCSSISCRKCRLVSEVTRNLQLGDFYLSRSQSDAKENDDMKKAQGLYIEARRKLNDDVWNNTKCLPDISKTPKFCSALGVLGACGSEEDCCGSEEECWHCGPSKSEKSLFLNTSIHMKWECIRRRHMVRVLTRLGKYCKIRGKINKEYTYLLECIHVLVCRSTFWEQSVSTTFVEKLLRKGVMGDAYGVEHASVLYKMCCFSLIHKNSGEEVDKLPIESVMMGLKVAFILSREVRKLHEKVSRLLAVMYARFKDNSTPERSMSRWASYFHQASIGSYFNSCFLSQERNRNVVDDLREVLSPHSLTMLETSVSNFFKMLPEVSILCISMLDGHSEKFLEHLLPQSRNSAWIMVSKMSLNRRPILIIVPICQVFEGLLFEVNPSLVGNWTSYPWAHSIFDRLAPRLRRILEEDSKVRGSEMESRERKKARRTLDKDLQNLLRDMEIQWFGPWIHLLLGEWSDNQDLDTTVEEIMSYLTKDKLDALVDRRILKAVIEGVQNDFQEKEVMAKLKLNNGFFIGMPNSDNDTSRPHLPGILKHIRKVLGNKNEKLCRNPVILVLDNDIQMFPIENMPLLRMQEIYRMPSVGGIIWSILKRERSTKDQMVVDSRDQTNIDPRDCYYLVYTDIEDTKSCFGKWSRTYNFEGCCTEWSKSRDTPETLGVGTLSELRKALKTRDLFVYLGHGDGRKLIQAEEIRQIDSCAAVFLIGCNSGYISYSKSRVPDGAPVDYLLASSPAIVANMWIVTTGCMNLFTTELLQAWINTKSAKVVHCDQAVHEKVEHNKNPNKRKAEVNGSTGLCIHKRNLGSSLIKAREIVRRNRSYKDLVATVVYGVPFHITGNNQNT